MSIVHNIGDTEQTMNRRNLIKTAGIATAAGVFGSGRALAKAKQLEMKKRSGDTVTVEAKQSAGKRTHWILPGTRRLDPKLFGTPVDGGSTPQLGMDAIRHRIWALKQAGNDGPAGLLAGDPVEGESFGPFPVPVGWPEGLRGTNSDGTRYTRTTKPLPFSDRAVGSDDEETNVDGEFELTYFDRQGFEGEGDEEDAIELDVWFKDPAGNRYEIDIEHLEYHDGVHPHGRGVMTGAYLHGTTGIGTPLMPTVYTFGSFWGVGNVSINGEEPEPQNTGRLVHFMTTQNVRMSDYTLAIDGELPLGVDGNPTAHLDRPTHTHGILPPVRMTAEGPRRVPLKSAFELPNGMKQPFVHFMWDEDVVQID